MDRVSKNVIKLFKETDFKIEIETNLKIVNFLDVKFSLTNSTNRPYSKQNDKFLSFILLLSTHPKLSNSYWLQ